MQDYVDELHEDSERLIKKVNTSLHDLVLIGQEIERFDLMESFRGLITEKELLGDDLAVEVLSWAYEKLSEITID